MNLIHHQAREAYRSLCKVSSVSFHRVEREFDIVEHAFQLLRELKTALNFELC